MSGMKNKGPRIEEMGEFAFIRSVQEGCHFSPKKLIKGIGDDCAVIGPYEDRVFLISTDLLVENIHFIPGKIQPEHLGEKAVAVNLSDIAAMGGTPLHLFMSLAIPPTTEVVFLHSLYRGIKAMCRRHGTNILGGDTSASPNGLMINITVMGEAQGDEVLFRQGAREGDKIYVTGTLGDSAAGLKLIKGELSAPPAVAFALKEAHNRPVPQLEAGRIIAQSRWASAMIDVSDGLLSDLGHICEASGVGGLLFKSNVPLSENLKAMAGAGNFDPYELAMKGGEDYQLLVTVPGENTGQFEKMFQGGSPCRVYCLGEITEGKGIQIVRHDGVRETIKISGFNHFTEA